MVATAIVSWSQNHVKYLYRRINNNDCIFIWDKCCLFVALMLFIDVVKRTYPA
jgi:hypothetical protein